MPVAMNVSNAKSVRKFFKVLQTGKRSQTAVMRLRPGQESGPKGTDHPKSEQVLLVMAGSVVAEIGSTRRTLKEGDVVIVPAGAKHRFSNPGRKEALTFNVYAPPAYDEDEEE
jgi:mannose-6-phosphate isomerase-like protein (cupin superfamily)